MNKEKKELNEIRDWFNQNYHTHMDSFLGKYGVPVLHVVHSDGQEEWEDIPFEKVLKHFADQQNKELKDKLKAVEEELKAEHKRGFDGGVEYLRKLIDKN